MGISCVDCNCACTYLNVPSSHNDDSLCPFRILKYLNGVISTIEVSSILELGEAMAF